MKNEIVDTEQLVCKLAQKLGAFAGLVEASEEDVAERDYAGTLALNCYVLEKQAAKLRLVLARKYGITGMID